MSADERRGLLIVTRLGLRFGERPLESSATFARRLNLMRRVAAPFVGELDECVGWIIETDDRWFETLGSAVADGRLPRPPRGRTVISRRGTADEATDLSRVGLDGRPLLAVRMDSDDRYLRHPILEALAEASALGDGCLVDMPHGYLVSPGSGVVRRHSYVMQGPFFGVTTTGPDLDDLHVEHTVARSGHRVVTVPAPAWIQTVHGDNIVTNMHGGGRSARLRQLRREWARRPSTRRWREAPRFLRVAVPVRAQRARRLLGVLDGSADS